MAAVEVEKALQEIYLQAEPTKLMRVIWLTHVKTENVDVKLKQENLNCEDFPVMDFVVERTIISESNQEILGTSDYIMHSETLTEQTAFEKF